jgi:hypothetical protein
MKNKICKSETNQYLSRVKMKKGLMMAPPVVNDVRVFANETNSASTVFTGRFATVSATLDK